MRIGLYGAGLMALDMVDFALSGCLDYWDCDSWVRIREPEFLVYDDRSDAPKNSELSSLQGAEMRFVDTLDVLNRADIIINCVAKTSRIREIISKKLRKFSAMQPPIKHSASLVSKSALIGFGSVIYPFANVGAHARVGKYVIVQNYSVVAHQCRVGDSSILAPSVLLGGKSQIGSEVFLCSKVFVYPGRNIGDFCMVDVGLNVKTDLEAGYLLTARGKTKFRL